MKLVFLATLIIMLPFIEPNRLAGMPPKYSNLEKRIAGFVLDDKGKVIGGVIVRAKETGDQVISSNIPNEVGKFDLTITKDVSLVTLNFIGPKNLYAELHTPVPNLSLGKITLKPKPPVKLVAENLTFDDIEMNSPFNILYQATVGATIAIENEEALKRQGVILGNGKKQIIYTPEKNYCTDKEPIEFHYCLVQGRNKSLAATGKISVKKPEITALFDVEPRYVKYKGKLLIDVLKDDKSRGNKRTEIIRQPTHGKVIETGNNGQFTYEPKPDFCDDEDEFEYRIKINGECSATSSGIIKVKMERMVSPPAIFSVNAIPYFTKKTVSSITEIRQRLSLPKDEADNYSVTTFEAIEKDSGQLTLTDSGLLEYSPSKKFCGVAKFRYRLKRGDCLSEKSGIIEIPVDSPEITAIQNYIINTSYSNRVEITINELIRAKGKIPDLKIAPKSLSTEGGTIKPSADDQGLTYIPNEDFCGNDSFDYTIVVDNALYKNCPIDLSGKITITVIPPTIKAKEEYPYPSLIPYNTDSAYVVNSDQLSTSNIPGVKFSSSTDKSSAKGGKIEIISGGNQIKYTPKSGSCNYDTFNYELIGPGKCDITSTGKVRFKIEEPSIPFTNPGDKIEYKGLARLRALIPDQIKQGWQITFDDPITKGKGKLSISPKDSGVIEYEASEDFCSRNEMTDEVAYNLELKGACNVKIQRKGYVTVKPPTGRSFIAKHYPGDAIPIQVNDILKGYGKAKLISCSSLPDTSGKIDPDIVSKTVKYKPNPSSSQLEDRFLCTIENCFGLHNVTVGVSLSPVKIEVELLRIDVAKKGGRGGQSWWGGIQANEQWDGGIATASEQLFTIPPKEFQKDNEAVPYNKSGDYSLGTGKALVLEIIFQKNNLTLKTPPIRLTWQKLQSLLSSGKEYEIIVNSEDNSNRGNFTFVFKFKQKK